MWFMWAAGFQHHAEWRMWLSWENATDQHHPTQTGQVQSPAPVRTKNLQPTLDGHVISTTNAFLQDKSHSAVTQAGQKSVKKHKHLASAFMGALCTVFERQDVKQTIRVEENMAQQQRHGEHDTLKPGDVHLVVWRASEWWQQNLLRKSVYSAGC